MADDPNDSESDIDGTDEFEREIDADDGADNSKEFDPNESEDTNEQDEFDPNIFEEEQEGDQFDPNASDENREQDEFNPNDSDKEDNSEEFDPNEEEDEVDLDNEYFDPNEQGGGEFEQYSGEFENQYAQTMNTILISEEQMLSYLIEYAKASFEREQEKLGEESKLDNFENEPSELEQFLEQEKERIQLEQQQAEVEKSGEIEQEPEPLAAENDVYQEQQDNSIDPEQEPTIDEKERELEQTEEIDSHENATDQVVTEKINESELEQSKFDDEFVEEKLDFQEVKKETIQVDNDRDEMEANENLEQEIEMTQEPELNEIEIVSIYQEEELELEEFDEEESELSSQYQELESRDTDDPQQELEEVLEQVREIEQKVPSGMEQQQHELEYRDESIEREIEQEKEREWQEYLSNWLNDDSEVELLSEVKENLSEIVEDYNELDELTTRFQKLYQKEQSKQFSKEELVELKTLVKALEKNDPANIVLFTNLRAIKRYLSNKQLEKPQKNQLLNHFFTQFPPKKQLSRILKANKNLFIIKILKFTPKELVELIEQLGSKFKNSRLDIQDKSYLQKKKKFTYSSKYSDGDIEFWIELFKIKHYGGTWPNVFKLILEFNKHLNQNIVIPNQFNDMTYYVKRFFKQNSLSYEEFKTKYGNRKKTKPLNDKDVFEWIKIYQDPEIGGSISAIRSHLEKKQGYTYGETTIRRHIKNFFKKRKYVKYFGTDLSYENWMKKFKRTYFREDMPSDPILQSHEYILLYNSKHNQYQRVFIKDLENPELLENLDDFQILGISNKLQPDKVKISRFIKREPQESLEIICSHGSVIISPDQFLFTLDDDCNIIEIKGSDLKAGMPILMPRIIKIDPNNEPLDLINCGKLISSSKTQYIEQYGKRGYRYIKKNANLGEILGQYEAEGTIPSKFQPGTVISVSTDYEHIQKLQKMLKDLFGLEFQIEGKRVNKCKNCGSKTIEKDTQNICPKCNGVYNEYYNLRTKTQLAKTIFTEGLGIEHAYSYLKEIPSFLYNSPMECDKGFIVSYFKGDGSERDYRSKGKTFDLNFETTSRRLVFGLNLLMKKLGVIMSVSEHNPPSSRPNSKKLYSMVIRGSSNFEKLNKMFENLPEIDYTTSDIKTSVNTHVLIRRLNLELQKNGISLRELSNKGIIPKNAVHIATQVKRKSNLSEVLLLKTLDGLKNEKISTPLVKRLEKAFRNNTFTKIKKIKSSKPPKETYDISVEEQGYCSGTAYIYVKSEEIKGVNKLIDD